MLHLFVSLRLLPKMLRTDPLHLLVLQQAVRRDGGGSHLPAPSKKCLDMIEISLGRGALILVTWIDNKPGIERESLVYWKYVE